MNRAGLSLSSRWLAVLMLLLRVLGPTTPTGDMSGVAALAAMFPDGMPICHAAGPGQTDPAAPSKAPGHDCQLCLGCHLAAHAPLLPAEVASVPFRRGGGRLARTLLPPATAPPATPRRPATPPTGPPASSV